MAVLVTCKYEDLIKVVGARVVTALRIHCSGAQGQLTSNSKSFKLLWLSLLPARVRKIHPKINTLLWSQQISHYKSVGIFQDAQAQLGSILPNFKLIQAFMVILLTSKNEEDPTTRIPRIGCVGWQNRRQTRQFCGIFIPGEGLFQRNL